jgi:hypothetical protein
MLLRSPSVAGKAVTPKSARGSTHSELENRDSNLSRRGYRRGPDGRSKAGQRQWQWGNGELTTIYHDPETRKNSISYRTNMARLTQQLINEGKTEKAKKIIDLALTKMPMDYYSYYTMLEPFAAAYYEVGEKAKARALLDKLTNKYKNAIA